MAYRGLLLLNGDVFISVGDATSQEIVDEGTRFPSWLNRQHSAVKILIAGNHDQGRLTDRVNEILAGLEVRRARCTHPAHRHGHL